MRVWRLVSHHINPVQAAEIYKRQGFIAVGWGHTGDLREWNLRHHRDVSAAIKQVWPEAHNHGAGGRVLWSFLHEMEIGDLVIVSNGKRRVSVMQVTSDYYWTPKQDDVLLNFQHRRSAEFVAKYDPDWLWKEAGGAASGWSIRWTLVPCKIEPEDLA